VGSEVSGNIWSQLLHKKSAVVGIVIIILSSLLSILAYIIIPDKTNNANEQISEIALQSPLYSTELLKIKRNLAYEEQSWIEKITNGLGARYDYIPIDSFSTTVNELVIKTKSGKRQYHKLWNILHAVDAIVDTEGDSYTIIDYAVDRVTMNKEEAVNKIRRENIVSRRFYFGTDRYGRDILSRIILGLRVSLIVGLLGVIISLTVGLFLGLVSGYNKGIIDDIVMWLINTVWSIPTVLLVFAIVIALGRSINVIFLAVGLTLWVDVARIVRGQVLELREEQFVVAAKSLGYKPLRIMFVHILPNLVGPLLVICASNFAIAILLEAGLSYLGFGVQAPTPSLGNMLNENYAFALGGKVFIAIIPAIVIMLLVLSFNLAGNGLRDVFDVKSKT